MTGFLLAGIGQRDAAGANFLVVDAKMPPADVAAFFGSLLARGDVGLIIVSQPVADSIRATVVAHTATIPMVRRSAERRSVARCGAARRNEARRSAAWRNAARRNAAWRNVARRNAARDTLARIVGVSQRTLTRPLARALARSRIRALSRALSLSRARACCRSWRSLRRSRLTTRTRTS